MTLENQTGTSEPAGTGIRIGLTDDQPLFRAGIAMVVNSQPDLTVVWQASDGAEAVARCAAEPVDVVLMDLEMPRMGGVEAITRVMAADGHPPRFIVLTTFDLDDKTFQAVNAGASGFLLKTTDPEFLLAAIRTVHSGSAVLAPSATANLVRRFAGHRPANPADDVLHALTARERDLFAAVAAGLSNAEIAAQLHLSDATVKTHVSRILSKLELRDRVQLVIFAYQNGLSS
ncbi:response regulator [Subtercola endophyticus]|uniref:response regulator n=1 Tax=Subtercola endophyticus TaxID=2895559 RepID=UPI001E52BCE0|nr:response regulator transcription factor [Subtercola endophyticus]UFS57530.1 response regulator transcription factor [Subtercola endophyticus]